MINLTNRLQTIADRIDKGETMADIGTDHGFLPIYMVDTGISPRAVMTDVSEPSLMKGQSNFREYADNLEACIDFRTGDGLTVLEKAEVDTVVIAGMGGKLMIDIMNEDMEHTISFKKFILQPRKRQGELRKWLLEKGFTIIHEDLAEEGRYITEIITAVSPGVKTCGGEEECLNITAEDMADDDCEIFYRLPPWIIRATGPVEEFIERNLDAEKRKLENVMLSKERNSSLEKEICDAIYYLKGLLEEKRRNG